MTAAVANEARAAARTPVEWLLDGPAQMRDGPHAGAVAGAIDAAGCARYVYPEITGYFLHWLAWRAACRGNDAALAARAGAAQAWLGRWLAAASPPPTRIHLDGTDADWRNGALFFFDVAMAIRGLAAAARWRVLRPDPAVVAGLDAQLRGFVGADGLFAACVARAGGQPLPERWSTRRGGFLAKAAAGVIAAAEDLPGVGADVAAAAQATYAAALYDALAAPHADVHPLLYTFEGILGLPRHARFDVMLAAMEDQFGALLDRTRFAAHVPETLGADDGGVARNDVLAQTLRIGHVLGLHRRGHPSFAPDLARLRHTLAERVTPDGAVPFAAGRHDGERNVWATMFAEQALAMFASGHAPLSAADVGRLLV